MLSNRYSNSVERYDTMDEIKSHHSDCVINGIQIRKPHFFSFDGSDGSHHSIIEFVGPRYGYDNILIGTNGAAKTVYLLNNESVMRSVHARDIQPLETNEFIVLGSSLYHIPTGKSTTIQERSFELVERIDNVLDFKNKDKQIEWTGNGFETYTNINQENESTDKQNINNSGVPSTDLRDTPHTTDQKYRSLLRRIVNNITWVKNTEEAEAYVNGDFEISDGEKKKRKFQNIKSMYASGEISIEEFEEKIEQYLINNEEFIWTTGDYADSRISDFTDSDEEDTDRGTNSAYNW